MAVFLRENDERRPNTYSQVAAFGFTGRKAKPRRIPHRDNNRANITGKRHPLSLHQPTAEIKNETTNKIIAVLGAIVTILGITASVASGIGYSGIGLTVVGVISIVKGNEELIDGNLTDAVTSIDKYQYCQAECSTSSTRSKNCNRNIESSDFFSFFSIS
jgi:hypothetical protein